MSKSDVVMMVSRCPAADSALPPVPAIDLTATTWFPAIDSCTAVRQFGPAAAAGWTGRPRRLLGIVV